MRRLCLTLALLVGPAALVACGGDDALSKPEFVAKATAICATLNTELQNKTTALLAKDANALSDAQKLSQYFIDVALPVARQKLDRLEKLKPPKDDRDQFEDLISEGRSAVADVEAGLKDDPKSLLSEGPNPLADFDDMARDLGLTGCAAPQKPSERHDETSTTTASTGPTTTTTKK